MHNVTFDTKVSQIVPKISKVYVFIGLWGVWPQKSRKLSQKSRKCLSIFWSVRGVTQIHFISIALPNFQ